MTKAATRTINVKLSEPGHKLLRTLSAESGLTYARTIELALATLDETADHGVPEPRPERRKPLVVADASPTVEAPIDPAEDGRYYAAIRQGLLADDEPDLSACSEGSPLGNDGDAASQPSEPADPKVTLKGDTEPAPPSVEPVEAWMAELFDGV